MRVGDSALTIVAKLLLYLVEGQLADAPPISDRGRHLTAKCPYHSNIVGRDKLEAFPKSACTCTFSVTVGLPTRSDSTRIHAGASFIASHLE